MVRRFVAGDRVQQISGGPTMAIIKYAEEDGEMSDHFVECIWFEDAERKKSTFDQRTLFKVSEEINT